MRMRNDSYWEMPESVEKIEPKELLYCKKYRRIPFKYTDDKGYTFQKNIVIFEFDGAEFFQTQIQADSISLQEYTIEIMDYIRLIADYYAEPQAYEFLVKCAAGRLIHKETGEKKYGIFLNLNNAFDKKYEDEGFFYVRREELKPERQYINPIYYPRCGASLCFVEAEKIKNSKELDAEEVRQVFAGNVIFGKRFFQCVDSGENYISLYHSKEWWVQDEAAAKQLSRINKSNKRENYECDAIIEECTVEWGEDRGRTCLMRQLVLRLDIPEENLYHEKGKGTYRYGNVVQVKDTDIGIFREAVLQDDNDAADKDLWKKMKTYAEMLQGKQVKVNYLLLGTHIKDKRPVINMHIEIPEIYLPPTNAQAGVPRGKIFEVLMHDMPAEKVLQNR